MRNWTERRPSPRRVSKGQLAEPIAETVGPGIFKLDQPEPRKREETGSEGRRGGGDATEATGSVVGCVLVASPKFGLGEVDKHTNYRTNHIKSLSSQLSLYSRINWSAKKM